MNEFASANVLKLNVQKCKVVMCGTARAVVASKCVVFFLSVMLVIADGGESCLL